MHDYKDLTKSQLEEVLESEKQIRQQPADTETERLLHELQVHQIELEMQNRELREAQQKLELTCTSYSDLYDFAPIGYMGLDSHGVVREINLTAASMLGRERARILGQPLSQWLCKEDLNALFGHIRSVLDSVHKQTAQIRIMATSGRVTDVHLESIVAYSPELNIDICRMALIDFTELKYAENALLDRERQLALITDAIPVLVAYIDNRLNYRFANLAHEVWLGRQRSQIVGRSVFSVLGDKSYKIIQDDLATALKGQLVKAEYHIAFIETQLRAIEVTYIPHRDNLGHIKGVIVLATDLSEHKMLADQDRQLQMEQARIARFYTLGEMAAGLAHEINQPLFAISNYVQASLNLLQSQGANKAEILHVLHEVAFQAERAGDIVRSIRRFVKKDEPKVDWIDINAVIADVMKIISADIKHNNIEVVLELDDNITHTHCDRVQIEQVLLNLIRNAIEAMAENNDKAHQLIIRSTSNEQIHVSIIDNGVGIAVNLVDKVFLPFITSKPTGMGFGLSISKTIIEQWGGHLSCANNETGGSTFSFTLPIK